MNQLRRYAQLMNEMAEIKNELAIIEAELKTAVAETGTVAGFGYMAHMKPGRSSTDHEAAALAAGVPDELIEKHTIVKPSISWAKVTKEAGVDVAPFTKQGDPVFAIEAIE